MRHLAPLLITMLLAAPALAQGPRGPLQRGVSPAQAPDLWLATEDGFAGWQVHSIHASEAAFEIASYTIEVSTADTRVEVDDLLGQPIVFGVRTGRETFRVRHAHVFAASASMARPEQPGEAPRRAFVLDAAPWTRALAMTSAYATFEDVSAIDVLRSVFARHPFTRVDFAITRPLPRRPLFVQYQESDLELVQRVVHEAGLVDWIEHRADGATLVIGDRPPPGRVPVIRYDENGGPGVIEHWGVHRRVGPNAVRMSSPDPDDPRRRIVAEHAERPTTPLGVLRITDHMHVFDGVAEGRRRARALLAAQTAVMRTATGSSSVLEVGASFTLRGHPAAAENGRFRVVSVSWGVETYEHVAGNALEMHTTATVMPLADEVVSPIPAPRFAAPASATVLGPTAGRPHLDATGRVRVCLHWAPDDRGVMPEAWVRVASGPPPSAGDEVVVQFLDGRPDRPVILR